jgi:hypothetical protein
MLSGVPVCRIHARDPCWGGGARVCGVSRVDGWGLVLVLLALAQMSSEHPSPNNARELAEQAIDDAMEDLAQRNEIRAKREAALLAQPRRDRLARIGLLIALPVLLVVGARTSGGTLLAARLTGTATAVDRARANAMLKTMVEDVQAFRADYAELPASLAELGLPAEGEWRYTRVGNDRYRIEVSVGGYTAGVDGR